MKDQTSDLAHTPGPWEFAVSGTCWSITADAEPVYIAVVEIPSRPSKIRTSEANARLIASAPDLLEILQIVSGLDRAPTAGEKRRIASVIAKATTE